MKVNIEDLYYIDGLNLPLGADTPNLPQLVKDYVERLDDRLNWEFLHLDTPFYYDVFKDSSNVVSTYIPQDNKWNQN